LQPLVVFRLASVRCVGEFHINRIFQAQSEC
jgi:hypothetical protein